MIRLTTMTRHERILLIGDEDRRMYEAATSALPDAEVVCVGSVFDAIAELADGGYTTVLTPVDAIERRPEAAVRTLRQLVSGRLLLFGDPTHESLSRKMLEAGCDDYLLTPADAREVRAVFDTPLRPIPLPLEPPAEAEQAPATRTQTTLAALGEALLSAVLVETLVNHPQDALKRAVAGINGLLAPEMRLWIGGMQDVSNEVDASMAVISHPLRMEDKSQRQLWLALPREEDQEQARHVLAKWAGLLGQVAALQDRHNRLQKLVITDDLTGVYNGRYFRHFLGSILERAREMRFPVSLLLFDIDNFKQYNDQYGHGVGDEILKQTAALMRKCCRDHDLVARISGDEFAVVFWEKDGPRQPHHPTAGPTPRRPRTPLQILDRFQRLLKTQQFNGLGVGGQGVLTISGGMAIFPYDAQDMESLIAAADRELMFRAKRAGKNSIFLVGSPDRVNETSA